MDIKDLRGQIDSIDDELVALFRRRMEVSQKIAEYTRENHLPILVPAREREKLQDVSTKAGADMANYTRVLYSMIFELSRSYQSKCNLVSSSLHQQIQESVENTPKLFPRPPWWPVRVWKVPTPRLHAKRFSKVP